MKIVSAHQPAYVPWLGYFHKVLLSDEFVIMDDVQFEKNSFINRNKVLANGTPVYLTIPIDTKDYLQKPIREMRLADTRWKSKQAKTLEQSYKKCACFDEVFPWLSKTFSIDSPYFIDYSNYIFFEIIKYLDIQVPIRFATDLAITSKKLGYVIELTRRVNGDVFLFGALGRDYADEVVLRANEITPLFQNYVHPEYPQGEKQFFSHLSIVDLLMRFGKSSRDILMAGNISRNQLV